MDNFPWDIALAGIGIAVPIIAFLWEFAFVGRKRLGYRVQMDTNATDEVHSGNADALAQLLPTDGTPLVDPSLVLLRIENNGTTHIDGDDYAVLDHDKVGIRVNFPGRRVVRVVVTELSAPHLRAGFGPDSGLGVRNVEKSGRTVGVIELPKVPLNRSAHYKVLVVLDRASNDEDGRRKQFEAPEVVGGIKGGVGNGGIQKTRARTGPSRPTIALICFLVGLSVFQLTRSLFFELEAAPLDCATGQLTVAGSTAFAPVLREAADSYGKTCPGASFTFDSRGSTEGLLRLDQAGQQKGSGSPDLLAFSDGTKGDGHPQLLPRPVAFSLFTLVINKEAGVQDLSLEQIRQLYGGRIANWKEIGGNDQPVRLVGRHSDSGTRTTFQEQILGTWELGENSVDCQKPAPGTQPGVVRCARASTNDLLDAVARTPGALGYSDLGAASGRQDLLPVRIDGHQATLEGAIHGAYPFWETEYAYTYGEPRANSLAASFLRCLTNEVGKDIVRSYGHRPCAELENPVLCHPS